MVIPKKPVCIKLSQRFGALFTESDFRQDYKILKREIQKLGVNIPPLVNAYMNPMQTIGIQLSDIQLAARARGQICLFVFVRHIIILSGRTQAH